jgi:hypothetical protein
MNQWWIVVMLACCLVEAGVILLLIVLLLRKRSDRHRRRRALERSWESWSASTSRYADQNEQSRVGKDVRELVQRLEQLTRLADRQIQSRLKELDQLIAQADAKTAEIRAALAPAQRTEENYVATTDSPVAPHPVSDPDAHGDQSTCRNTVELGPLHGEVLRLAGQGLDAVGIARRVQKDVGQIELVLNLYPGVAKRAAEG